MTISATTLRQNMYKHLDGVLETGKPIEIKRKGKLLKIISIPANRGKKKGKKDIFANIKKLDNFLNCDPEEIVHMDWSKYWKPYL